MCIHSAVVNVALAFPKVDFNLVCALWKTKRRKRERKKKKEKIRKKKRNI